MLNKFKSAIRDISKNPHIGSLKIGDLNGIYSYDMYYNKTNYEIAYIIKNDEVCIFIILIGERENFYKELKRYIN